MNCEYHLTRMCYCLEWGNDKGKLTMKKLIALLIVCVAFATTPALAGWDEAQDAYQKGDYATALREWRPLAERGDIKAQYNLGSMYNKGEGVPQDYKEAAKWYRLSAEQGDASAQYNLGLMYAKGQGVLQNYKEAAKLYSLSAEQGVTLAQNNLGVMYEEGQGVLQDYLRAHMWYNIAALNGQELAPKNRDIVAKKMTSLQIEKAQDLAKKCLAKDYKGC